MDRKLASVQRIVSLDPIPDADKIEKATILGWEVVVAKKDNFKVGNLAVYIEVDSVLPDCPEFEFLRDRKFRVKTIKLKKQISQGLVLPLSVLPDCHYYNEGDDVTEILKIKKYDPEGELEQKLIDEKTSRSKNKVTKFLSRYPWYRKLFSFMLPKKAGFPKFIKKTDEDRIQLFPNICEKEKDNLFSVTEKLDGQSGTYFLIKNTKRFLWFGDKYIFGVCSRNLHLPKPDNSSYWTVAKQFNIRSVLENIIGNWEYVVLQGEIIGTGIQGNKYKINGYDFYAFNLVYPYGRATTWTMKNELDKQNIKCVPVLEEPFVLKPTIHEMVEYAKGKSTLLDIQREGVVVRRITRNNPEDISFKVINPEFLLKFDQ